VLTRLADHAGRQINELREIASVEHEVIDLLAGDGAGEIGRSGFDLGNGFAGNFNCLRNSPDSELHVNAGLFGNVEYDLLYGEFLKTLGSHDQIIGIARQTGYNVCTVGVCSCGTCQAASDVGEDHLSANDRGAGFIYDRAADIAGILSANGEKNHYDDHEDPEPQMRDIPDSASLLQTTKVVRHDKTSKEKMGIGDDRNGWK